jgi:CP family cyanate transporter-like MFS transporter
MNKFFVGTIITLSYTVFAMIWVAGNQLAPLIGKHFHITSQLFLSPLNTSITVAKILVPLFSLLLLRYLNLYKAVLIALFFMLFSLYTPFSTTYWGFLITRCLLGIGGSLMAVYIHPLIAEYFDGKSKNIINGINAISFNLGTIIILYLFPSLVLSLNKDWQLALFIVSFLMLFVFLLSLGVFWGKDSSIKDDSYIKPSLKTLFKTLCSGYNIAVIIAYSGLLSFFVVLFTYYPLLGKSNAKLVIVWGTIGGLIGAYVNKSSRIPRLAILKIAGVFQIIGVIGFSFINNSVSNIFFSILLGLFMNFQMPMLFSLIHEKQSQKINLVNMMSLFWSLSYLIATINSTLFALFLDIFKTPFWAYIFIILITSLFFIGSFFIGHYAKNEELPK